jgi:hypothetical protein
MSERELLLLRMSVSGRILDREAELDRTIEAVNFVSSIHKDHTEDAVLLKSSMIELQREVQELKSILVKLFRETEAMIFA